MQIGEYVSLEGFFKNHSNLVMKIALREPYTFFFLISVSKGRDSTHPEGLLKSLKSLKLARAVIDKAEQGLVGKVLY